MENSYPITEEQKAVLRSFTCERLCVDPENRDLIAYFKSKKGSPLVYKLVTKAWLEDRAGSTAYYVVKNPKGQIVLFFSLKCGSLFDPDKIGNVMKLFGEGKKEDIWNKYLMPEIQSQSEFQIFRDKDFRDLWIKAMDDDIMAIVFLGKLKELVGQECYEQMDADIRTYYNVRHAEDKDPNKKLIPVTENMSAIELVEFCANDETKKSWLEYDMNGNRMGETLFWHFVVGKMLEANQILGSEYAYLFAADKKIDGRLVSYYSDALHFEQMTNLGTVKPDYDRFCFFMGQRLKTKHFDPRVTCAAGADELGLEYYQKEFFDNFNENPEAEDFL